VKAATAGLRPPLSVGCVAALGLAALTGVASAAPAKPDRPGATPDISGFWIPRTAGLAKVPPASLTPAFVRESKDPKALAPGRSQAYVERWCIHRGMPSQMYTSGPIDIIQTPKEVGIAFEPANAQRYIYTDGRKRPSSDVLDNTTAGFSIGHWEGRTLVVDTAAFDAVGVRDIPGGGWRGETSHLVERFDLTDGGKTLTVTQTWTDPKVFARPHSYKIVYDRARPGYSAVEVFCDAIDPSRAKPVVVGQY
jgi:hypothetical protein